MTLRRRQVTGWIAIGAILFGAVSPALAATLFRDRPDILARMLALPAAETPAPAHAAATADDGCPHEPASAAEDEASHSAHGGPSGSAHDESKHTAHGIFCSFCLTASATLTLPAASAVSLAGAPDIVPSVHRHERDPAPPQLASHRSRAPPVSL